MKNLASLILVALFALINSQSASAQQGQLERNILGVVYEENEQPRDKEDKQNKDRAIVTVVSEVKLNTPVNRVEVELSEEAAKAAQVIPLDGWQAVKGKKGITWTTDLPTTTFRLHVDFPVSLGNKLDGKKLSFGLGNDTIGTLTLKDPKKVPLNVITNLDEAGTFPSGLRPSDFNSFVPQEKFANSGNGNWFARLLGTFQGANRNPDNVTGAPQEGMTLTSDEKGGNVIPATSGLTDEDFRRGVDYTPGRYLPLDQRYTDQPGGAPPKTAQDAKPPLGFFIPGTVPPGTEVEVGFIDRFGRRLVVGKAIVTPDGSLDFGLPPFLITCTPKIFMRDKLCVCGSFPTQFSRNQLLLDGKPLGPPLSGSRDTLVFQPEGPLGRHVITWNVEGFKQLPQPGDELRPPPSAQEKVEFVLLDVKGIIDQNKLYTGEGTTLRLQILGTEEQLDIELTNKTPQIVSLEGSQTQIVKSSGGPNNVIVKTVKGLMRGNFNIVYRLALPPCPCNPELTSEVGSLVGRVKPGSGPSAPNRKSCEELVALCDRLEEEWQKLEEAYQQALKGCRDENCINAVTVAYQTKVNEAYKLYSRCLERNKECYTLIQMSPGGPQASPANNPTTPENQEPEGEEDCEKIKKSCKELADRLEVLKRVKNQLEGIAKACAEVKSDQQAKENCKSTVLDSYASMIKALEQQLAECNKRLDDCLDPFEEQDRNVEATTEEECQKLRKGCAELEAEEKRFVEFVNNKLAECATEYKDSPAALENCKRAVSWKYQEALLGFKESVEMCRKRVTDCVSRLRPLRPGR